MPENLYEVASVQPKGAVSVQGSARLIKGVSDLVNGLMIRVREEKNNKTK